MRLAPTSLAGRLLVGSALATTLALVLILVLMHLVFTRFVTGQIDQRLDNKLVMLASQIRGGADGRLTIDGDSDGPPFDQRRHHSFWIVEGPRNGLRSRWLGTGEAVVPAEGRVGGAPPPPAPPLEPAPPDRASWPHPETATTTGPDDVEVHERILRTTIAGIPATILAAAPTAAIAGPVREAMVSVAIAVAVLGVALAALAALQVRLGLRPLRALRDQVAEIGDGRRDRLPLSQPREIEPLVVEVNRLLDTNAANLDKARRHVANLAHGLKTPLATLSLGVERLDGANKSDVRHLLAEIDIRIRHHLGRARAAALGGSGRTRTVLAPRLGDIGDALGRIHADRALRFTLQCPSTATLACEAQDVDEMFGNLLDNAFKYARTEVVCLVRETATAVVATIRDDGPGLSGADVAVALEPGRRLDEAVPGHGFGLTIVRELVELYGGALDLRGEETGLVATVTLPGRTVARGVHAAAGATPRSRPQA